MGDTVIPFDPARRRNRTPPAPAPDPHAALHPRTRQAPAQARELAAQQNAAARNRYDRARAGQRQERLLATGRPVPTRITVALNLGGHEGPQVDLACGTWEGNLDGDVDGWEAGTATPTAEQVKLLAALTGFPVSYFYLPVKPGPFLGGDGNMWICWRDRRGCVSPEPDWVDERGVLHYGGEPPRTPPPATQGALF
jgi:hypothetical protein